VVLKPLSHDTAPAAHNVMVGLWRGMTPSRKMSIVLESNQMCDELALAGIRRQYPAATEHEQRMRLAARRIDRNLMIKAFGWDPELHGR
jgi:hypothetical protein